MARDRSKQSARPKVKLAPGKPRPKHRQGTVPGRVTSERTKDGKYRTSFTWESELDALAAIQPGKLEEADAVKLAVHLQAELQGFIKHGLKLASAERKLYPVLKAYAEAIQRQVEDNTFYALARAAALVAAGRCKPGEALKFAQNVRRESSWDLPDEGPVSEGAVRRAAESGKRGPRALLPRAERIYRVLAWNSRATEQPKDTRRESDLQRVLGFWLQHFENSRKEVPR